MSWAVLVPIIIEVLKSQLPRKVAEWLVGAIRRLFSASSTNSGFASATAFSVSAAPEEVHRVVKDLLDRAVASIRMPVVRSLVAAVLGRSLPRLLDAIYDKLFLDGHLTGSPPPARALAAAAPAPEDDQAEAELPEFDPAAF